MPDARCDVVNGITLCDECHNHIVTGHEGKLIRLFAACLKTGKPVSEHTFKRLYRQACEVEPRRCACGCGKWTRIIGREPNIYIRGHAQIGRKLKESHRLKIIETHKFTDDKIIQAQTLYDSGLSTIAVAKQMGVSTGWVSKSVKVRTFAEAQRLRFQRADQPKKPLKQLPIADIVQGYAGGLNPFELAAKYGVSHMTIRSRLRDAGVYSRPQNITITEDLRLAA